MNSNCIVTGLFYRFKKYNRLRNFSNLSNVTQEGQKSNVCKTVKLSTTRQHGGAVSGWGVSELPRALPPEGL